MTGGFLSTPWPLYLSDPNAFSAITALAAGRLSEKQLSNGLRSTSGDLGWSDRTQLGVDIKSV